MSKQPKTTVCFYCRVSTGSKEQYNSFENQKDFFEKFIKEHPELELYRSKKNPTGIYADRGISGTLLHREKFDEMLCDAGLTIEKKDYTGLKKWNAELMCDTEITYRDYTFGFSGQTPAFNLIITKSTSRFSRNILINDVLRKLAAIGVYVWFLDINKTTQKEDDISVIQLFQSFDEMFSRDLSRKLLAANEQSRQNQILRSNHSLYGYQYHKRKNRQENNSLTIIESESYIIQMFLRLYFGCFYISPYERPKNPPKMELCNFKCSECSKCKEAIDSEGMGFRNIRMVLNEVYGFRTRKGKKFTQTTLKHIFENEKYAGYLNNGKWDHGPLFNPHSSAKIRESYKDIMVYRPDIIPPIISMEFLELCNAKREKKADVYGHHFRGLPSEYKGKLFCGKCGSAMTHNKGNDGTGLYNCRIKKTQGKEFCDNGNIYVPQFKEILKKLCEGELAEILQTKNILLFNTIYGIIVGKIDFIKRNRDDERVTALAEDITQKTQALSNLYVRQAMATTDTTALDKAIKSIEEELPKLKDEFNRLTKKPASLLTECDDLLDLCYEIITTMEESKVTYTEEELWEVIEKFMVYSEVKVIKGGLHGAPTVSAVPILKTENLLSTKFGIEEDLTSAVVITDFGFEDDRKNFILQLKTKSQELFEEIERLKTLYS